MSSIVQKILNQIGQDLVVFFFHDILSCATEGSSQEAFARLVEPHDYASTVVT